MAFRWDQKKEDAAAHIAVGELTKTEIAAKVGVSEATVYNWLSQAEFVARVEEQAKAARDAILSTGIADVVNRVRRRQKRWLQIDRIFEERANSGQHIGVPGYSTGLLAHEEKSIGSGELATVVDVYRPDVALLKEEREIEKQVAIELGQWEERSTVDSKVQVVGLDEALERAYGKPS